MRNRKASYAYSVQTKKEKIDESEMRKSVRNDREIKRRTEKVVKDKRISQSMTGHRSQSKKECHR